MNSPSPTYLLSLDSTTSTNDEARRLLRERNEKYVIVTARHQSAGRGQQGHRWESEEGKNLLFSLGVRPTFLAPRRQFLLLQAMSVAICQSLSEVISGFTIKWPNDIYFADLKICGTLIEVGLSGSTMDHCIIGSGVNVNQTLFSAYPPNPVSLRMLTHHSHDCAALLQAITHRFITHYEALEKGITAPLQQAYMQRLYRREGIHPYQDREGTFMARILSVEPDGHLLLLTTDQQRRRYAFKEVRFVL
ncbi:MAG: biotin--[Bacteroidaceae bacterium]|nr:biotin--[acetyl-CoA-carboxylase] ligase [Bacteroidaceae bacterium]